MTRRLALTGIAVLTSLTLATACQGTPGASPTTPAAKTATELLNDSVAKSHGQSFKYDLVYGELVQGNGSLDPAGPSSQSAVTLTVPAAGVTIKVDATIVGGDIFIKMDLGPLTNSIPGLQGIGDKWMHIDKTKIGNSGLASRLTPSEDSIGANSFVKGVVTAEKVSDTEIKGTMDLTKSAPGVLQQEQINAFGEDGKKVPFVATLDAQGRISKLVLSMPKAGDVPAQDLTTTYSDYGTAVTITKPTAAETVDAPDLIYTFLQ
jgi:hypothetical protein